MMRQNRRSAMTASLCPLLLILACSFVHALEGDALFNTVEEMKSAQHAKYAKSHKKFRFFDSNNDEILDREEFEGGLKKLGYKTAEHKLNHIMSELDMNGDGRVEFVEFMRPTAKKYQEERELEKGADTDRAMEHFDRNLDGRIEAEELFNGLSHMQRMGGITKEQVETFVREYADVDGDGFVSYEELETIDPELL